MGKRILFIGASKYGNLGDDAYLEIFNDYFGSEYELIFTHPFPDLSLVQFCDYIVIGGGGLIYDNQTQHFNYMSSYLQEAIKHNKPFSFTACGIQLKTKEDSKDWFKQLHRWKPFLEKADIITVRSEMDKNILLKVSKDINVKYYPDLVYLIKPVDYHFFDYTKNYVVFIPTNSDGKRSTFKKYWNQYKSLGKRRIVLTMALKERDLAMELAQEINSNRGLNEYLNISPREACRIIKDASLVITCRYHGLIMANSQDKEVISCDTRYKSLVEKKPEDKNLALGHLTDLQEILNKHFN